MKPSPSVAADRAARRLLVLLGTLASAVTVLAAGALWVLVPLYRSEITNHCLRFGDWLAGHPEVLLGLVPLSLIVYVVVRTAWRAVEQGAATTRLLAALDRPRPLPERLAGLVQSQGMMGRLDFVDHPVPLSFCHGLCRPRICVSAGLLGLLDDAELAAVLRHEHHHLARHDPARLLVARALCDGIGFLPGVAAVFERYIAAMEIAADAASARDDEDRLLLAEAVLKLLRAQQHLRGLPAAPISPFSPLVARVESLLAPGSSAPRLQARTFAQLAVGIGMLMFLTAAPIALSAKPDPLHPCTIDVHRHGDVPHP